MNDKSFQQITREAVEIINRYKKIEGREWPAEGIMLELTKQVGELSKLILVHEGYYFKDRNKMHPGYEASQEKIADELADILRCVIRLANHYQVDVVSAHDQSVLEDEIVLESKGI